MHLALYQAATQLAARTIRGGKLGDGLAGRRDAAARLVRWAAKHRRAEPLIWVHAASVGETLAAESVVQRLCAANPLQIARTYSSPSAALWPGRTTGDVVDFAPLDTEAAVGAALEALHPAALVFSRGDLWPVLVGEAQRRSIPVVVIGGVVRSGSRRLAWPTRRILEPVHATLHAVGAVSTEDGARWRALGVPEHAVHVTGDPRHDWCVERPAFIGHLSAFRAWQDAGRRILVAGSVEPEDEGPLFDALATLRTAETMPRLVLVPHEPDAGAVGRLLARCTDVGINAASWQGGPLDGDIECIVVTTRGQLADLYLLADIAYVGGGFGRQGTHSVAEAAAYGVPVMFGVTRCAGHDERALIDGGGAVAIEKATAGTTIAETCRRWLANDGLAGREAGLSARRALVTGAARASADLVRSAARL